MIVHCKNRRSDNKIYLSVDIFLDSVVVGDVYLIQVHGIVDIVPHVMIHHHVIEKSLEQQQQNKNNIRTLFEQCSYDSRV